MKNLIVFVILLLSVNLDAQDVQKYINVTGKAEVTANADQINMNIQIRSIDSSIENSKKKNDKYVNELVNILNGIGIDNQDIEISPVTMGKNYEYEQGKRIQKGFYTNVVVVLSLKNLSKYYELIDKISLNDVYEIGGSHFGLSNYESLTKSAYQKALLAAKEKAEYMAQVMEVHLGDILEIDEQNTYHSPAPVNTFAKEDYQSGGISGKVTVSRSIRVKFGLK